MKTSVYIILISLSSILLAYSCNSPAPKNPAVKTNVREKIVYTCTMHPEVRSDKPGKCPKCGMDLVRMEPDSTMTLQIHDTVR